MLAGLSGLLLVFSFPTLGHPACAWIALAPLIVASSRGSLSRAFLLGVTAGAVYFGGTLYWLARVMIVYGNLDPWIGIPVNIALVAVLALFPGAFAFTHRSLFRAYGRRALLAVPLIWAATELARTYVMSGFPWVLLGYSQTSVLSVAQFASIVGVYGLGGLVSAVNAAAAAAALREPSADSTSPSTRLSMFAPLAVSVFAVVLVAIWGGRRIAAGELTSSGTPVKVGLLQGNVDQAEKWDVARASAIFDDYLRLTREAIDRGASLVIWPESSTPFYFEEDPAGAEMIRTIAREKHVSIIVGSNQIEHTTPPRYFNAAFMVRPDGSTAGVYRKMHLVPFGEYVPLKQLFFFANHLVEAVSDFTPGTVPIVMPVDGHNVSVAICYEIVYPDLVRQYVRRGSELLTTITNDAWFGPTSAPYQHFEQAAMRAIEEGRYLVRAANTGISGIVDPYGRVLAQSPLYQPLVVVGEARYLQQATMYSRIGDLFAYLSAAVSVALLLQSRPWRPSTN